MSFVAIFSGSHCHGEDIAGRVAEQLGYERIDQRVLRDVAAKHGTTVERLVHCMQRPSSLLDAFRRDRGPNIAYVREAMADWVVKDGAIYHGFGVHLLPKTVSHVLKVCVVASRAYRGDQAMKAHGISEKKARKLVEADDAQRIQWTQYLFDLGPWDERLYDEIIPVHTMGVDEAVRLIVTHASNDALAPSALSRSAAEDFLLASRVGVAAAREGHAVRVTA
ncbi:MAG: cytidylate kinase-like family protein, partial [Polyangiaceae bacterium]|nr:cytidylate kinase-like family protein [Polyangiaceae bacterium]